MDEEYISHYGVKRRSGRYPWGSGKNPYQREEEKLKKLHEKIASDAEKERDKMWARGDSPEKIYEYVWATNNKVDNIQRKITRLNAEELASYWGISDKKAADAVADYKWAKKMARQYASEGKNTSMLPETSLARNLAASAVVHGPRGHREAYATSIVSLKGADYYERLANIYDTVLRTKIDPEIIKRFQKEGL